MDGRHVDREAARRLGKNLWRARRRAGYSQEELGSLACLHRTEVGMVENGERLPRIDTLMKLAAALEVRLETLVEGIEWLPPGPPAQGSFAIRRAAA
jgi:transcriptional regulator with XRE-family HTH domain